MTMQCLSAIQCSHVPSDAYPVCGVCQSAHDRYARRYMEEAIRSAYSLLTSQGYKVIPPARDSSSIAEPKS